MNHRTMSVIKLPYLFWGEASKVSLIIAISRDSQAVGPKGNRLQNDLAGANFPAFLHQWNNHRLEKRENLPSPSSFFASIP
jgi:hypothetical protein